MPVRYGPIAAWLVRATAHQLIHGRYPPTSTSTWLFADVGPIIEGGMKHNRIKRFSDFDYFENNHGRKNTKRPIVLDFVMDLSRTDREDFYLEGIGLTEAAVEWLIENRYVPAIYRALLENNDGQEDILADPNFQFWREHIYIAPPEKCPVQKPSSIQRTKHDKARTYTGAERLAAITAINARTDIDARAKAAHKAHVTRRTVEAT